MSAASHLHFGRAAFGRAILALLMISTGVRAQASSSEQAPALSQAEALRDSGRLQESAALYERVIAADPGAWEPRYAVAQIYMSLKQYEAAEQQLLAAVLASPSQPSPWARLGQVYLLRSDPEKAERALVRARELNPADPGVHYNLGKLFEKMDREQEALTEYVAFVEGAGSDPRAVGIRRRLIMYYDNTNQPEKLLEQYKALVLADPNSVQFHSGLGDSLYKQSSYDEAYAEYLKVLAMDPNNAPAHYNVGFINKMKGNLAEAERALLRSDTLAPGSARTLYQLGAVQFERGEFAAAAASFEKVIGLEPDHPQAHYHYSRALTKLGRTEEARHELQLHQEILRKVAEKTPPKTMERP